MYLASRRYRVSRFFKQIAYTGCLKTQTVTNLGFDKKYNFELKTSNKNKLFCMYIKHYKELQRLLEVVVPVMV